MATIAESGLDGLTMAGLGREVGMSSGHLLYYFGTKDELLLQTLEWSEEQLGAERRAALSRPRPGPRAAGRVVDLYLPDGHRDPHWTLWLEVWNRSQNADDEARERQAAIELRLAPRPGGAARRGHLARASSAPSTPTASPPAPRPARRLQLQSRRPAAARTGSKSSAMYGSSWTSRWP